MSLSAGSVPDPARPWLNLFNTRAFYGLRQMEWNPGDLYADGEAVGTIVVTPDAESSMVSGHYAPYGGVDWMADRVPPERIDAALSALPFITPRSLVIRCAPTHFGTAQASTLVSLHRLGFRARAAELSYWIPLPATVEDYERGLKHEARVALARTEDHFWTRLLAEDDDEGWVCAFDLLDANRRAKGRRLSFDLDYLWRIRAAFPGLVRMVVAADDVEWRAAALVYRVRRGCDYVQWWGDLPGRPGRSPMNVLARACVFLSIATGARALDLGVSSNDGMPDSGLCRFKRSVGAVPEVRWTLAR